MCVVANELGDDMKVSREILFQLVILSLLLERNMVSAGVPVSEPVPRALALPSSAKS